MKTSLRITAVLIIPVLYLMLLSAFKEDALTKETKVPFSKMTPVITQIPKDFTHFILNVGYKDQPSSWEITNFWDYYRDSLSYNGIQMYHYGDTVTGHFAPDLTPGQISRVNGLINTSLSRNLKPVFQRAKIFRLCENAFRMVYEAEGGNDGYSYQSASGCLVQDSGRDVINALVNNIPCPNTNANPRWLCKDIKENLQHHWRYHSGFSEVLNWHVKPVMRIKQSDFDNPAKRDLPVVRIVTVNYKGDTINSVILRVWNFRDPNFNYYGQYKNIFTFSQSSVDSMVVSDGTGTDGINNGYTPSNYNVESSKVDFKVYWYGEVDVWFDKMVVDNDYADKLFNGEHNDRINQELDNFGDRMGMFFVDECGTTNLPCIKYVQDHIRNYNQQHGRNIVLSYAVSNNLNRYFTRTEANKFKLYLDTVKAQVMQVDAHAFQFNEDYSIPGYIPANALNNTDIDSKVPDSWKTTNNGTYNTYLQNLLGRRDQVGFPNEGSFIYQVNQSRVQIAQNSPETRLTIQPQIQGWLVGNTITGKFKAGFREPLNEEISAQAWIALTYGADNLCWFWLPTFEPFTVDTLFRDNLIPGDPNDVLYSYGLFTEPNKPRRKNLYGQNKYDYLRGLNSKILTLKPTLDAITWKSAFSVHSEGAGHEFISNIQSIDPHRNDQNPCPHDGPSGPYYDCDAERYWEMGFYNDLNGEKYFTMVNRRCVPANTGVNPPLNGDDRVLLIKFNLPGPNNWKLSEVGNFAAPIEFNKNVYSGFGNTPGSLGWFKPGEGKLFKIVPVPKSGGTLVTDEIITDESFTCEAPVYNNGHNITIGANTTIHFNDSSRFVMTGGVFTVGDQNTSAPQNITSDAVPGGSWRGHSFTNCEVKIYGAAFTGLANDTTYAVNIIDCPVVDIRNCTFNTNSSLKGGINAICFSNPFIAINNIYIGSNTFNSSGSTIPTVNVSSYAGVTTPLIIENNTFNEGNTAIFLSGVIGGAIKGNTITDNYIGINSLTSSIDVVQNNISSTVNGSMGIFAAGGSELKLNSSGTFTLGGLNNISNEGTGTNNINVDGSYFLLDDGENIFNISSDQSSYHLYGYFPMFTAVTTEGTNNCFKVNTSPVDPPINMVTSGYQGTQITFNFIPYLAGCEIPDGGDGLVINLGNGIYDTICTGGSGSGGSHSGSQRRAFALQMAKEKYDSISVLMRYRNYSQAKTKCLDLINTYPDSIQSLNAVSKLFLATVASDTSYNVANNLKIYYENLILNHQSNTSLVKRANYYILKCKVRMREYSQALAGFQQIINLNPYSYEGLIARWDYMATSLLIQGQGGGERGISDLGLMNADLEEASSIDLVNALQKEAEDDDKSPFSKEQRQDIRKSINTAIDVSKNNDETKMKTLEEKSELGDVNASKELTQMKSLKQVVKTEKPKSITQHIKIVSEDIRKVFGTNTSGKGNQPKNLPTVFRISQNYPNPFNPTTKINYDLPKDSKVNIVIYDILGREVKRLVNNEIKQAGSYIVDFNASNYASGVYFYRIEAEEPNGNKFVDSKKMVLLK